MSSSVQPFQTTPTAGPDSGGLAALEAGELHLWIAGLDGATSELEGTGSTIDRLAQSLPQEERKRAGEILAPQRRAHYVWGRVMLRSLLDRYLGEASAPHPLEYLREGKPVLATPHARLHFSVAHSEDLLTIAFSSPDPVGVDVERIRPMPEGNRIAQSYFTEGERRWLDASAGEDPDTAFFSLWTSKEAVVKAAGGGISHSWSETEVVPGSWGQTPPISPENDSPSRWTLLQPVVAPGYAAAVAVARERASLKTFDWNPTEQARR